MSDQFVPPPTPDEKLDIVTTAYEGRIAELERQLADTQAALARALEGLQAFADKIDVLNKDPDYLSVWMLQFSHGGSYKGPTLIEEYKTARSILSSPGAEASAKWLEERKAEAYRKGVEDVYKERVGENEP